MVQCVVIRPEMSLRWLGLMLFNLYVFFLIASGVVMLVMGSLRAPYARRSRVANFAFGAGFTIYGLYLLLFFQGGHYVLFLYAFLVPIVMIIQFFRGRSASRTRQGGTAFQGQ